MGPYINANVLMILAGCQDGIQISVREEYPSPEKVVCRPFGDFFDPLDKFWGEMVASKLLDELVIVDLLICGA